MAPSSLPFPQATPSQPTSNPKADQIVSRYLHKVVLVVANARLSNDSQDTLDNALPTTPGLGAGDSSSGRGYIGAGDDDGAGTPTGSITAVLATPSKPGDPSSSKPTSRKKQAGPKVDKWFNLEVPDSDTFKQSLHIFRSISTSFPISPSDIVVDPPPLIIQVLLSIPQPALNQVLVLTHSSHRTRIDPTPRYILLESWRVDITRPSSSRHDGEETTRASSASSTASSSQSMSSASTNSLYDVELPTVYKQSIALFRSIYSLLRVLPTWKLRRQIKRRNRTGIGGGMSLELRVEVPTQSSEASTSSSATTSVEDLPSHIDNVPIIDFSTPLSLYSTANKIESVSFPSIASPLGLLKLSMKYRTQTDFALESLEGLLSYGFESVDRQRNPQDSSVLPAPVELYSVPPNPPPNYPQSPYPPVAGALTRDEHERERRLRGLSRSPPSVRMPAALDFDRHTRELSAVQEERDRLERMDRERDEREFEMVSAAFTPTVVIEQQRRRRESQTPAEGRTPLGSLPPRTSLPHSPRSQPGSLPREPLAVPRPGTSPGSDRDRISPSGSTYSLTANASAVPPRSRYNSIPHSSSPLSHSPRLGGIAGPRYPPLPSSTMSPMTTPTQHGQAQPLPTIPQYSIPSGEGPLVAPLHSRTISMPSSASRPSPLTLPSQGVIPPAPASATTGRFAFSRTEDLPFASSASGIAGSSTARRRKESSSALSSTSSAGGGGPAGMAPSPSRPSFSPRSRPVALPATGTPLLNRTQTTPPNASGAIPLPAPRRPSNTIHPFKSSTLSSSPGSFSAGRLYSPLSERGAGLPVPAANAKPSGLASSQSPRSPIGPRHEDTIQATGPTVKRLSSGSIETPVRGVAGYSPDLSAGMAPPSGALPMVKRYSSSFAHRHANSTSTTGSGAGGIGGVPGSLGSAGGMDHAGAVAVGSAGSGGSGGRRDSLGLAGIAGTTHPSTLERHADDKRLGPQTDDDDIGAYVRSIDSRPQLRGGLTRSRLGGSPASDPSVGSLPRGSGGSFPPETHTRVESDMTASGATGQTSAAYMSAFETQGGRTREPSEDVVLGPSELAGRIASGGGIAVPTSRMDVDETLRRMKEEFGRGIDTATQARRQQQQQSVRTPNPASQAPSPRGSGFTQPRQSAAGSPRTAGTDRQLRRDSYPSNS